MLKIILGDADDTVYYPPVYFDNTYEDRWITDDLAVEMIRDIDKSEVKGARLIVSPVLGPISVKELSGGVKTLMLMAFDESGRVFNASACGNNCAKWILRIAENKDITINLRHLMDFGEGTFKAEVLNNGKIIENMSEFVDAAGEYI